MAIVIDGITLPPFPEGAVDETYKNYVIFKVSSNGELSGITVMSAIGEAAYVSPDLANLDGAALLVTNPHTQRESRLTIYNLADQKWSNSIDDETGFMGFIGNVGSEYELVYANHDVKIVTEFDAENMEWWNVGDEIYFPNSEAPAEPEYGKIRRQHMRDIGDAIRRKTGKKDKIPTPQLASEIDSIVTADNALVLKDNERIYQLGVGVNALSVNGLLATNISGKVLS